MLDGLKRVYPVRPEPLDRWGDWLDLFYEDPKRHALGLHVKILLEFVMDEVPGLLITERSPQDTLHVFARCALHDGHLLEKELELIRQQANLGWSPDVYIYLRAEPEVCIERVRQRTRACEQTIDEKYLRRLHDLYEAFVKTMRNVHVVDASRNDETVLEEVRNILEKL